MSISLKLTVLLGITALFFATCSNPKPESAPVDMDNLKTEIQAMEDAYAAGEKAKDADAVATYYADDAISYGRNRAPELGKAAIREYIAKNIAADSTGG